LRLRTIVRRRVFALGHNATKTLAMPGAASLSKMAENCASSQ
jgi:hypothetical protein